MACHLVSSPGGIQTKAPETKQSLRPSLQFKVLRQKATEPPGTGKYEHHSEDGVYTCAGCGAPLYYSTTKFKR
jgi:peptide-methionine (R)-S-oxide reductase